MARHEPTLTPNALEVLRARYLKRDAEGNVVETPADMLWRVATHVAAVERQYGEPSEATAESFYDVMARLQCLPNSPTLMNAGTTVGQLAACFVLPIDDSLDGIFRTLHDAALIHQSGGGVGYDFSALRPAGDRVSSTGGVSSGPVSFMRAFDAAVEAVRQGGRRRGANMAVLDVHHPDVEQFIGAKRDGTSLRHFDLSVAVDDGFMAAAANGTEIALTNPRTGKEIARRKARDLLERAATAAWETGDPGLIFVDRNNRDNPTPALGRITATNPCGEVPLLPYEACVLGSVNLSALTGTGAFDWPRLDALTDLGIRFLDDCVDASIFPLPEIAAAVQANRKVGLGVMGFADALIDLGIGYDTEAAIGFATDVMKRMAAQATQTSRRLADTRGPYPNVGRSRDAQSGRSPLRNATRIAIAPTGSLSLIAGCSSGIEPLFAVAFERHVLDGSRLVEVNSRFERLARQAGVWTPALRERILVSGRVRDVAEIPEHLRVLFTTAHEVPPEQHIRLQAACQAHVDNAVSKTINLPADATVDQVTDVYRRAFELGCKGITVYRHGTRAGQVLTPLSPIGLCPDCLAALVFSEGASLCRSPGPRHVSAADSEAVLVTTGQSEARLNSCECRCAMVTEDQAEVVAFLSSPSTHGGAPVERIETHAAIVFLAGTRAWKLKRAVRYDYLDFSTGERRKAMCDAEVQINRRTAPDLYRGVVPVTRQPDGSLALGGSGTPVDWLVEMDRFDQESLFDRLAARGSLSLDVMRPLATALTRFHQAAERRFDHGGAPGMAWVVEGNATGLAEQGAGILDQAACAELTRRSREEIERHRHLLESRRDSGCVRQCHGDLHLRNIVLVDGRPTLFDGIEFNDEIACTDVLYDLAFLLMDLWRRQLPRHANVVWNGYLIDTAELGGIPLLPLFLSCRAAVRAKTSATAANLQADSARKGELQDLAREYLVMARELLQPLPACLIAVGGFSGSCKSTVARALAPLIGAIPGAVVIRSDETRKEICGVDPLQRLGPQGYTAEISGRVYAAVAHRAAQVVAARHAALADAVYARPADREAIERVAAAAQVPFVGLWLDAPEPVLIARSEQRRLDASDADAAVIRQQLAQDLGTIAWRRIDASRALEDVLRTATAVLSEHLKSGAVRLVSQPA